MSSPWLGGVKTQNEEFFTNTTPEIGLKEVEELLSYEQEHYTGGISVFRNVLDMSLWDEIYPWLMEQVDIAHANRWEYRTDENGETYALNEDDNKFTLEQLETSPIRVLYAINEETPSEFVDVFRDWEDTVYKCVLGYTDVYPYLQNCLWWRTRGHFMAYRKNSWLGPHADADTNYRSIDGVRYHPQTEFPSRQSISITACLNNGSGVDYDGGELYFPYFDTTLATNAGDIVIFPCNYMGLHELKHVTEGLRLAYLIAYGQGTDNRQAGTPLTETSGDIDVKDILNMWTPPAWVDNVHKDYAEVWRQSPRWSANDMYNPMAQNRPLEGQGLDKAGGGHFTDTEMDDIRRQKNDSSPKDR